MLYPPSGLPDFTQAPPDNSSQAPALPIQLIAGSPSLLFPFSAISYIISQLM